MMCLLYRLNARNSIRSGFPDNFNSMGNVSLSIGRFATINPGVTLDEGDVKRKVSILLGYRTGLVVEYTNRRTIF